MMDDSPKHVMRVHCSGLQWLAFIGALLSLHITFMLTFLPVYVQLADLLPCSVLCSYANVDSSA